MATNPITPRDFPNYPGPFYLAYAVHSFPWFSSHDNAGISLNIYYKDMNPAIRTTTMDADFGFAASSTSPFQAPIWVDEFGAPPPSPENWISSFQDLVSYISEHKFSFGFYTPGAIREEASGRALLPQYQADLGPGT